MRILLKNDYVYILFNKVITLLIGLMSTVLLTRYLGTEHRGTLSYITQVVSLSSNFLNLGINQFFPYKYKNSFNKEGLKNKILTIYIFQFIVMTFLVLTLNVFIKFSIISKYILISIPLSVLVIQLSSFVAITNLRRRSIVNIYSNILKLLLLIIIFLFFDRQLIYPIIINWILDIFLCIKLFSKDIKRVNLRDIDLVLLKEGLKFGWVPMLSSFLLSANYSLDVIFLKWTSDNYNQSIYAVANSIIIYFWIIPDSFKEVTLRNSVHKNNEKEVNFIIKISLYTMLALFVIFFVVGSYIVNLLFGISFKEVYNIVLILSIGALSMIYFKILGVLVISEGRTKVYFWSLLISVVINGILNYILTPIYGMYGAAISTVISYTLCGLLFLYDYSKNKNIRMLDFFLLSKKDIINIRKRISKKQDKHF